MAFHWLGLWVLSPPVIKIPVINRISNAFDIVVAIQDWHPPRHKSFAANHQGKKPFETIQWKGNSAKQEIFNKLDARGTHARGLFGKTLLITAYPLDERAMRRAKAYNIQPVLLTNLTDLKTIIKKWMNGLPTN